MTRNTLPLPANLAPQTWWDKNLPTWLLDFSEKTANFIDENILYFIAIFIIILITKFWYDRERTRFFQIKKLWTFNLFFLSKRLMMIPLIITFARREKILKDEKVYELLSSRNACRAVSLKKNPKLRLKQEEKISHILYLFFTELENNGQLKPNSPLSHIAQDLEFIDKKLVELQLAYNHEARNWNAQRNLAKKLLGLQTHKLFE